MNDPLLAIDVYSDVICPWCYVGKRRLERALVQLGGTVQTRVTWRPFQLNPTMPKEGMERRGYLKAKFGSVEAYGKLVEQVSEAASTDRISFAFEKISRTPNTFLAHRLIWYAERLGGQSDLVEQLFKGYFEEGADIGSVAVLAHLAERVGLKVETFLRGNEGTGEVQAEEAVGRRLGIRSVPYFLLNQAYSVSGAQSPDVLAAAIEEVRWRQEGGQATER